MPTPKKSRAIEPLSYDPELGPDYFIQIPQTILKDCDLSDGAFRLYCILLSYCRQKLTAWPGQESLAADMGRTERQVRTLLSQLREIGLVDWQQNGHASNRYHVYKAPLKGRNSDRKNTSGLDRKDSSALDRQLISAESHSYEQHKVEQQHGDDEITGLLIQEGFSPKISEKLLDILQKNGRSADYLTGWITFIQSSNEIQRPQGYLRRMLEENNELPKAPLSKAQREKNATDQKMAKWQKQFGKKE